MIYYQKEWTKIHLLISTNAKKAQAILDGSAEGLIWASDNLETVAHYYEGCVLDIDIQLCAEQRMSYVSCLDDLDSLNIVLPDYSYGFALMSCPKGATWYVFSAHYLATNCSDMKEVFPDLSYWGVNTQGASARGGKEA